MNVTDSPPPLMGMPTAPGYAARVRAALPPAARAKLESIEADALAALALARTHADRLTDGVEEQRRVSTRLDELRAMHPSLLPGSWIANPKAGPRARTWIPAAGDNVADLERDLERVTDEVARLTAQRDAAQARWQSLGRLATACRRHLGLPE